MGDDLGVAGVGRLAAEDRGREAVAAELLVHQGELQLAVALAAELRPEVAGPQALRLHLFLQRLDELLPEARDHHVAAEVGERLDLLLHELFYPIELLLKFRVGLKIPGHASLPCARWIAGLSANVLCGRHYRAPPRGAQPPQTLV